MNTMWLITYKADDGDGAEDMYRIQKVPDEYHHLHKQEADLGYSWLATVSDFTMATCMLSGLHGIGTGKYKKTPEEIEHFHKHVELVNLEDYK